MKYFILFVLSLVSVDAFAAIQQSRPAMSNKIMSAPQRYTASINQLNSMANANVGTINTAPVKVVESLDTVESNDKEQEIDMREAERNACINNNIGMGNTFVWASRYSDTSNYANMVEDVKNPANNVCFVRVELNSDNESKVSVSDIRPKYFMWGENIECGSWVNEEDMKDRILAAKKGARVGGTILGVVGGAGVGVGAMELFGNKLIGGKVQGQKAKNMQGNTLYRSILLTYKEKGDPQYNKIVSALKTMKAACDSGSSDVDCTEYEDLIAEFAN